MFRLLIQSLVPPLTYFVAVMWSAIKSDLYEFISTVQEDAQGTISKVVDIPSSRTPEEEAKITEEDRILSQFRNDITTFSEVCCLLGIIYIYIYIFGRYWSGGSALCLKCSCFLGCKTRTETGI